MDKGKNTVKREKYRGFQINMVDIPTDRSGVFLQKKDKNQSGASSCHPFISVPAENRYTKFSERILVRNNYPILKHNLAHGEAVLGF